jgi:hypothetical protein
MYRHQQQLQVSSCQHLLQSDRRRDSTRCCSNNEAVAAAETAQAAAAAAVYHPLGQHLDECLRICGAG